MIKLYGSSVSNYYAMVKVFLLEKGFEFEGVYINPTYSEPFLELSPMGKIPCIEVDEGYLSETTAIMGFLESCIPELPMTSDDSFRRAQMAQLIKMVELYIAVEYARFLNYVFFCAELNQAVAADAKPTMVKGLAAMQGCAVFLPICWVKRLLWQTFLPTTYLKMPSRLQRKSGIGILSTMSMVWPIGSV